MMKVANVLALTCVLIGFVLADDPRKTAVEVLQELRSIRESLSHHVNSVKFVGVIRFFAIDALSKQPDVDPILIRRVENQFAPYYEKVFQFDGRHRVEGADKWIKEEPLPGDEKKRSALKAADQHLEGSFAKLAQYVDVIHGVQQQQTSAVIETPDDRAFVLVSSLVHFHAVLPLLQESGHDLDRAIFQFEQFAV